MIYFVTSVKPLFIKGDKCPAGNYWFYDNISDICYFEPRNATIVTWIDAQCFFMQQYNTQDLRFLSFGMEMNLTHTLTLCKILI